MDKTELKYLEMLSELYPTIAQASTEVINLQSIINLPKGTEHFITDVHGEYEAFSHVLKNGSGSVKKKIDEVFGHTLSNEDKRSLATLIYYPNRKIDLMKRQQIDMDDWYKITLYRLIEVCKQVASKYTRSKVRKALPKDFAFVIEELINEKSEVQDMEAYYVEIVRTIISIGRAEVFIIALSELIQRLVVDRLHILGDIYDRGSGADRIMDRLVNYHSLDIQWGNHDVVWMGAAAGQLSCIATVIRTCARYGNLDTLEEGYGINLLPLGTYALETYKDDPCTLFVSKGSVGSTAQETELNTKIHKAITVLQFKLEGQLIQKRPEFEMNDRALLHLINYEKGTITIDGNEYPLLDTNFPTIDPADPYRLTEEEQQIMERLQQAFENCTKLQQHMMLLLNKGGLYKVYNDNLLYHGCVLLDENGDFAEVPVYGKKYKGKALYDVLDKYVRKAYFALDVEEKEKGKDILWWLWCNKYSPLFGKDKMATFERYFIEDKATHKEKKNSYYTLLENEEVANAILEEFGLGYQYCHIINGHVPVLQKKGESPIKCNGKVLVIDGGFSKAYQKQTGIAGYTLIFNSHGLILAAHEPFTTVEDAINNEIDIHSDSVMVEQRPVRLTVADTDEGKKLKERIAELKELLAAYRSGLILEK